MAQEQDAVALIQARDAQRRSEASRQKTIEDLAKLRRAVSTAMAGLGVLLGPVTLETLVKEVKRLLGAVRELELATTWRAVHRVLAMFESHYQGLDRMVLSGGWALGISDAQCDKLEEDCTSFICDMADATLKDLELPPQDAPEDSEAPEPSNSLYHILFYVMTGTSRKATGGVAMYFIRVALHTDCFRAPEDVCSNA
jgi:hypothetical protein